MSRVMGRGDNQGPLPANLPDWDAYEYRDPGAPESGEGHADYCSKCGTATRRETKTDGFAETTGTLNVRYRTVCPFRRHWWDGHHRSVWLFAMPRQS